MFAVDREDKLNEVHWQPEDGGLYFIETTADTLDDQAARRLHHGLMREDAIDYYLANKVGLLMTL
jgi:hypothetical protein